MARLVTFPTLGTTATVVVDASSALEPAVEAVKRTVAAFDLACSRFRDDSDLAAVNAAAGAPVTVSELLVEAVLASLRAAELTDGDVDPTVGEALIALGYDRDFAELGRVAGGSPRVSSVPGWRAVEVDSESLTVRVPRGVVLDLGATAKALAADDAAAAAAAATDGAAVLVSLGGDIATAGSPPATPWPIRVTDDHRAPTAPGQSITIASGGLATSSTTVRRWYTNAGTAHHLIDPWTGRPTGRPWRTVTVAAASCLDANVASTAAVIRGHRAVPWLQELGLPSRLVTVEGAVCHVAGWPSDGDELGPATRAPRPVRAA